MYILYLICSDFSESERLMEVNSVCHRGGVGIIIYYYRRVYCRVWLLNTKYSSGTFYTSWMVRSCSYIIIPIWHLCYMPFLDAHLPPCLWYTRCFGMHMRFSIKRFHLTSQPPYLKHNCVIILPMCACLWILRHNLYFCCWILLVLSMFWGFLGGQWSEGGFN